MFSLFFFLAIAAISIGFAFAVWLFAKLLPLLILLFLAGIICELVRGSEHMGTHSL